MNKEILKQIEELGKENTLTSYNQMIELIDKQLDKNLSNDEKKS